MTQGLSAFPVNSKKHFNLPLAQKSSCCCCCCCSDVVQQWHGAAYLMVYSSVPSSVIRSSLFGMVMLWATDFLPLWKKVSGVQILLAIRLLRRSTAMGPLNFSLSSFQLCLKKTSMVYSYRWTVRGREKEVNKRRGGKIEKQISTLQQFSTFIFYTGKMLSNPTLFSFLTLFFFFLVSLWLSWPSFPAGNCLLMLKALAWRMQWMEVHGFLAGMSSIEWLHC